MRIPYISVGLGMVLTACSVAATASVPSVQTVLGGNLARVSAGDRVAWVAAQVAVAPAPVKRPRPPTVPPPPDGANISR